MTHQEDFGSRFARDAVITVATVLLAVAAFDDITTDSARSFPLERSMLAACAVWFSVVAWRLWRHGHRALAVLSFGFVTIGALAQPTIGPGTVTMPLGYLATVGALAWFLLVAGVFAGFAWRSRRRHAA